MQQATGAPGGQQMGYQPYQQGYPYQQMPPLGNGQQFPQQYQQGYQQPYQQMPQQQYNPWAQQMPPQPYQQWPQSFQQQMPPMQSSQQPAAQMMYPNAANQYAQPQPDVFVSDRGNAALGYLAQIKRAVLPIWRGRLETRPPLGHARSMTWRRPAWSSSMARNTI